MNIKTCAKCKTNAVVSGTRCESCRDADYAQDRARRMAISEAKKEANKRRKIIELKAKRTCSRCAVETRRYNSYCHDCQKAAAYESRARRIEENKRFIAEEKDKPCADCKTKYPSYVMDFDHLPGTYKINEIAQMVNSNRKIIVAEIAKCEVVCSNCHRERTHKRRQS